MYGFFSGKSCIYPDSGLLKKSLYYSEIHLSIVHNKDICIGSMEKFPVLVCALCHRIDTFSKVSEFFPPADLLKDLKREFRSLAVFALNIKLASHEFKELPCDAHSKTSSLNSAVSLLFYAFIRRKQILHILCFHTYARVFYRKAKLYMRLICFFETNLKSNFTGLSVLDRICKQVQYALPDADLISHEKMRGMFICFYNELEPLFGCSVPYDIDEIIDHGG